MPTARLYVHGAPLVEVPIGIDLETGLRRASADMLCDLGQRVRELEAWWEERAGRLVEGEGRVWVSKPSDRTDATTWLRFPKGTIYNGASLPSLAIIRLIMGPKELYEAASAYHDDLYGQQAPRAAADYVFWVVARSGSKQVTERRGRLGWAALRAFGWRAYWRAGR